VKEPKKNGFFFGSLLFFSIFSLCEKIGCTSEKSKKI